MADVSVTATSVIGTSNATFLPAGATITAGQPVYNSAGTLFPAKGDTAPHAAAVGIALNGGATGQPIFYQGSGSITFNACFTKGIVYVVSAANAGGIAPVSDLTTGNFVTVLGVAFSTTVLQMGLNVSGISQ